MERSSFVWIGLVLFVIVAGALVYLAGNPAEQTSTPDDSTAAVADPVVRPPPRTLTYQVSLTQSFFTPDAIEVFVGDTLTVQVLSTGAERIIQLLAFGQEQTIPADGVGSVTFSPTKPGEYTLTCVSACDQGVALTFRVR